MMMAIAAKASTMVIFAIIGIPNRSCVFGREPISRRGTRLPYSPLVEKPDHAQMREITRTWRRTRRLRLHATLMRDATSGPRALEVSIGIEILGVAAHVGAKEEAGGGCAGMCGGVAHACSFQNLAREAGGMCDPCVVCGRRLFRRARFQLVAECVQYSGEIAYVNTLMR